MSIVSLLWTNPLKAFSNNHAARTAPPLVSTEALDAAILTGPDWHRQDALVGDLVRRRDALRSEAASHLQQARAGGAMLLQSGVIAGALSVAVQLAGYGLIHPDLVASAIMAVASLTASVGAVTGLAEGCVHAVKGVLRYDAADEANGLLKTYRPELAKGDVSGNAPSS